MKAVTQKRQKSWKRNWKNEGNKQNVNNHKSKEDVGS